MFSGNANNSANAGFAYSNSNNVPSNTNANIGSHLCLKIIREGDRATWQKISKLPKVLVGRNRPLRLRKQSKMKRIGNLYEKIISIENLELADRRARKGKVDTYGVKVHDQHREENIAKLHNALLNKTFRTSKYHVFTIREPKEREIYRLPYYPDRIVHHAIMNILEPIWVKTFTYNTYSCIKHRGIEACASRVKHIIHSYKGKTLYCLKIDIRKYYPSINHTVLKNIVRKKIKDKDLLWLIDEIIDSAAGLPIGNYLSQYLSNLYLCYFMHWVNEQLPTIVKNDMSLSYRPIIQAVEYADDIVFFSDSKSVLHCVIRHISDYIEHELKLHIKDNWQIFPIAKNRYSKNGRALDYVGYKFYLDQVQIRKGIKKNFCRKVAGLNKCNTSIDALSYKKQISPWLGWAKHSDSINLLKTIIKPEYYESIL